MMRQPVTCAILQDGCEGRRHLLLTAHRDWHNLDPCRFAREVNFFEEQRHEWIASVAERGDFRALAVTTAMRSTALPDVPVMGESVPGYEASQWYGLGAPRNTPAEVIDKLNKEINAVAADPNMKVRFDGLGVDPMSMTSAEFGKFIADETEKWGKVIRAANIKAE